MVDAGVDGFPPVNAHFFILDHFSVGSGNIPYSSIYFEILF